jgi:hypothetical protein
MKENRDVVKYLNDLEKHIHKRNDFLDIIHRISSENIRDIKLLNEDIEQLKRGFLPRLEREQRELEEKLRALTDDKLRREGARDLIKFLVPTVLAIIAILVALFKEYFISLISR